MSPLTRPSLVWITTGIMCGIYAIIGMFGWMMPGIQDLIAFAERFVGWQIMFIGALAIFFEGLYLIGNFIPGSTLAILIAIIALAHSPLTFILTIIALFIGWSLAGVVNVYITARLLPPRDIPTLNEIEPNNRFLTTWYPVFRSSYEVAQVVAGARPLAVLVSSIKVKFFASMVAGLYAILLPKVVDIYSMSNQEGFRLVFFIAFVCLCIGGWLWRTERRVISS